MGEEKKVEEKDTKDQNDGRDEKPVPIVLKVDMHCEGCARKVKKAIISYKGVETMDFDKNHNMFTVKGNVDPLKLCERVRKKSGRKTELISPLPKEEIKAEEIKAEETKLEKAEPVVATVVLKVNMGCECEGCAQQVKKNILKMKGVQTVDPDFASHKVTVIGTMDPKKLVHYVYRRTGKYAQIVPPPQAQIEEGKKGGEEVKKEEEKKEEEQKEEKKEEAKPEEGEKKGGEENGGELKKEDEKVEGNDKKEEDDKPKGESGEEKKEGGEETAVVSSVEEKKNEVCAPRYVIEHVYPPQLFSDENPNACSIM